MPEFKTQLIIRVKSFFLRPKA